MVTHKPRVATGRAFGTFGELLQGVLPGIDRHFMVTLPISMWSTATFRPSAEGTGLSVLPSHKSKALKMARLALEHIGVDGDGVLELCSDLPEGKGMASSSADLVATARAVGAAYGVSFMPMEIEAFLRAIEPSDGVMYDEIVAYYHREAELRQGLGVLPAMTIVAHDEGGRIDTIQHNRAARPVSDRDREEYAFLLASLCDAVSRGDLPAVGRIATRSTELNSMARPRRSLQELQRICADTGGLGVACAHSGTVLGILFAADDPHHDAKVGAALDACAGLAGSTTVLRSLGDGESWNPATCQVSPRPARPASSYQTSGA